MMAPALRRRLAPLALLAPALLLLGLAFLYPMAEIMRLSLFGRTGFSTAPFERFWTSPVLGIVFIRTFRLAFEVTAICLLVGYPVAMFLAGLRRTWRTVFIVLVLLPFWTSILVKSFAFYVILGNQGIVNQALRLVFGDAGTLKLLFNRVGVIVGMAHFLIPFVVFPALASLLAQSPELRRAAQIMGAGPVRIFLRITLPLSMPGVLAGGLMSMVISLGVFVTPALLGGKADIMMANLIDFYTRDTLDWNTAAAIAVILLTLSGILIGLLSWVRRDEGAA